MATKRSPNFQWHIRQNYKFQWHSTKFSEEEAAPWQSHIRERDAGIRVHEEEEECSRSGEDSTRKLGIS